MAALAALVRHVTRRLSAVVLGCSLLSVCPTVTAIVAFSHVYSILQPAQSLALSSSLTFTPHL